MAWVKSFLSRWGLLILVAGATFLAGAGLMAGLVATGIAGKIKARLAGSGTGSAANAAVITRSELDTILMTLSVTDIPIGNVDGIASGGGIEAHGETVVVATALGRIGYLDLANHQIGYLEETVPMNVRGLMESEAWNRTVFNRNWFRVHDLLLTDAGDDIATLLISHHFYDGSGNICNRITSVQVAFSSGAMSVAGDFETKLDIAPCINLEDVGYSFDGHMSGGRLYPAGDGTVFMTVGDFGIGGKKGNAELDRLGSPGQLGRLLRLDLETGEASIFAEGLRNSQGLTIDSQGRIWTTDHGPQGGDEVNLMREGLDYGWPRVSLAFEYADAYQKRIPLRPSPVQGRHDGYEAPVYAFLPSVGVGQIIEVPQAEGAFPLWERDLLVASLRARTLFRIRLEGDAAIYAEPIVLNHRLRDMIPLEDGRIALLTDANTVLVLADPYAEKVPDNMAERVSGWEAVRALEQQSADLDQNHWARDMFRWKCGACHVFDDSPAVGPHLGGIVGRRIGSQEGYPYSAALAGANGRWSRNQLLQYIRDPAAAGFEGSTMPPVDDVDDNVLRAIIQYANDQPLAMN